MKPVRRNKKKTLDLNLTPLIDVIFMLLLFFILTSNFVKPSMLLSLPEASSKARLKKTDIVVSVDKNSNVFINREQVPLEKLAELLTGKIEALPAGSDKRIIFYGDEAMPYKGFVKVIDIIKSTGIDEINIAHEESE
jgi:biopolymer transport protein ExbD